MPADRDRRRVLIAAKNFAQAPLRDQFGRGPLRDWETLEADSFERARSLLRQEPCDVLLVDENVYREEDPAGRAWLARQREVPVLLLARGEPALVGRALANGVNQWLPRGLALAHPLVLAAALSQAAHLSDLRARSRQMAAALQESRQQVERLAGLLWQTLPSERPTSWLTQRQLMDRLQEEVSRAERYGTPLTVVLGQLAGPVGAGPEPVSPWVAERIGRAKRRCDVAGPYGPHGFLLLLVHTAESGAVACCRRLRDVLSRPSGPGEDLRGPVRPYFGIAGYSKAVSSANRLLRLAEQHLEAAKTERGGLVVAV